MGEVNKKYVNTMSGAAARTGNFTKKETISSKNNGAHGFFKAKIIIRTQDENKNM